MKMMTLAAIVIALCGRAGAVEIYHQTGTNGVTAVVIMGKFQEGDTDRLAEITNGLTNVRISFQSPGGDAAEGMLMSEAIRNGGFTTIVANGDLCASACAIAWLGGAHRIMSTGARIGFHAVYTNTSSGTQENSGAGNAVLGAFLSSELGLPLPAIGFVTRESANGMAWLTPVKARELGIEVQVLEIPGISSRVASPAPPPVYAPNRTWTGQPVPVAPSPQYRPPPPCYPSDAEQAAIAFQMFGIMVCAMSGRCRY